MILRNQKLKTRRCVADGREYPVVTMICIKVPKAPIPFQKEYIHFPSYLKIYENGTDADIWGYAL